MAIAPWFAIAQLGLLVVTCRVRAGTWPRPWVPDVDSVALPLQQEAWALTCVLALVSLPVTPIVVVTRRMAGQRPLAAAVLVNAIGVATMLWIARGDPGGLGFSSWAWD